MDTKEAIEFIKNTIYIAKEDDIGENDMPQYQSKYNHWMRYIIELLQRGGKYEAMWGEMLHQINQIHPLHLNGEDIRNIINKIKQKYFPKAIKREIIIKVEAENESQYNWFRKYILDAEKLNVQDRHVKVYFENEKEVDNET